MNHYFSNITFFSLIHKAKWNKKLKFNDDNGDYNKEEEKLSLLKLYSVIILNYFMKSVV